MTFTIETTRDREGNDMFDVAICENGEIVVQESFYELETAHFWIEEHYPNAIEE